MVNAPVNVSTTSNVRAQGQAQYDSMQATRDWVRLVDDG